MAAAAFTASSMGCASAQNRVVSDTKALWHEWRISGWQACPQHSGNLCSIGPQPAFKHHVILTLHLLLYHTGRAAEAGAAARPDAGAAA